MKRVILLSNDKFKTKFYKNEMVYPIPKPENGFKSKNSHGKSVNIYIKTHNSLYLSPESFNLTMPISILK